MKQFPASIRFILRPFWRWFLRFRRIYRTRRKLDPIYFVKFGFVYLVFSPIVKCLKIQNLRTRINVRNYGPFILRLATTDAECFIEVILEEEYNTATLLTKPESTLVFDAGSNVGYSMRFFQHAFPSAVIIGVEPDAENMKLCRDNVSCGENPGRVKLFECCIASQPGMVTLDRSAGEWAIRMKDPRRESSGNSSECTIIAKSVDQILHEAGFDNQRVNLFKCDIEGTEAELFGKPGSWLERTECLAVETHGPYYDICLMDDLRRFSNDFEFLPENELVFAHRLRPPSNAAK